MINKKLVTISNSDDPNGQPGNFNINFNNDTVTNESGSFTKFKKYIKPISLSIDLTYFNISEALANNKFTISSTGITGVTVITLDDGAYNGVTLGEALLAKLNAANITWTGGNVIVWTGTTFNGNGTITFKYVTNAPAGTPAIKINNFYNSGTKQYNTKKIFGFKTDNVDILYATKTKVSDEPIDLVIYNSFYIRSNIAKSFYKVNNSRLSNTDILMIVDVGSNIGGTLLWSNANDDYYQEILDNWGNMSFRITDKDNNQVAFGVNSEVIFTFGIETEIVAPTIEQKQKGNMDYLSFN